MIPVPEDSFELSVGLIQEWVEETWATADMQDIINLAVCIDNIYRGFDNDTGELRESARTN